MSALTEDEARERRCLFAAEGTAETHPCLTSACMGWRWDGPRYEVRYLVPEMMPAGEGWERFQRSPRHVLHSTVGPDMVGWRRPVPRREGFCGAAGKPKREGGST